jgi:hypothetical protein
MYLYPVAPMIVPWKNIEKEVELIVQAGGFVWRKKLMRYNGEDTSLPSCSCSFSSMSQAAA